MRVLQNKEIKEILRNVPRTKLESQLKPPLLKCIKKTKRKSQIRFYLENHDKTQSNYSLEK